MRSYLLITLALLLPGVASAQLLDGSVGNSDPFTISTNPQYPAPYSQAVISVLSATLDLTNSTMAVSVGGKQIYKGSVQPVAIPLGKAGNVASVTVSISSVGATFNKSLTVQPQDVSLIVEPVASAPVLYPGKASVPLEGNARVVAIANLRGADGNSVDPAALSYAWTVDGVAIANSSGIGKRVIIVASPLQYRERSVSVVAQSQDGILVGGASLSLVAMQPSVRIYENDPLFGIRFDRALSGGYAIRGAEASLYAAPFSFPLISGAPLLRWFLNGAAAQTGSLLTLRPSGSGQGTASLSLTASSAGTASVASASLPLSFGAAPSTNFFGL